ncbi:unnamed protein product [Ixodes hexagonus]
MPVLDEWHQKMDEFLAAMGFWRKQIAGDGSCLFRAVSEHVYHTQNKHEHVRQTCVDFISANKKVYESFIETDFDQYVTNMRDVKVWGGHLEIHAMADIYKRDFMIFERPGRDPYMATNKGFSDVIMLCYTHGNHYDVVYPRTKLNSAALCQSIVYEVLYKNVFDLGEDVDMAVKKMLYDKTYFKHKKNMTFEQWKESVRFGTEVNVLPEEEQASSSEVRVALANRIPPFPFKVAKALDPTIYRNVEYDIWNEAEKERLRREQYVVPDLEPGVKCMVRLTRDSEGNSASFQAHIQKMEPGEGPVTVFIEKLGKMCTVPFDSVQALPLPAHKVLAIRQGVVPYKLRSCWSHQSLLSNFRDFQRTHRRLLQRGKGADLTSWLPQVIAGSPLPPDFPPGRTCDGAGTSSQGLKCGDPFSLDNRPRFAMTPPPVDACQVLWGQTNQVLTAARQYPSCSSSQPLGFQSPPQWESSTLFDLKSTAGKYLIGNSVESLPYFLNYIHDSSGAGAATRNGLMDTHLDSSLYGHLSTVFEQQQPPSSAHMVDSGVWANPPLVPASPGPVYDFMPATSFSYAVSASPEHSMMADGSATNGSMTDSSGAAVTMVPQGQELPQLMSPMGTSSYSAVPCASMVLPFEPPAPNVNLQVPRSADPNGNDLPSDASTLRFFYNIGWDHFRMYTSQSFMYSSMHGYNGNFSFTLCPYIADPNVVMPDVRCTMPEGPTRVPSDAAPNNGPSTSSDAFAAAEQAMQNGHASVPLSTAQHQQGSGYNPSSVSAVQSQN